MKSIGFRVWAVFVLGQMCSLPTLAKYVPGPKPITIPAVIAVLALCLVVVLFARKRPLRLVDSWMPPAVFLVVSLLVAAVVYPRADGLKSIMQGSDQDDALITAVHRMFAGKSPYAFRTYFGNPASTAPGWLLMHTPFTMLGLYPFAAPILATIAAWLLAKRTRSWRASTVFILLLSSSLHIWRLLSCGSDLIAVGSLCVIVLCLLEPDKKPGVPGVVTVALGILLAASRTVFSYLAPAFGVALWPVDRKKAVVFGLLTLAGSLLLNLVFYLRDPPAYTPLHLMSKGHRFLPNWAQAAVICVSIIAIRASLRKAIAWPAAGFLVVGTFLLAPMLGICMGSLAYSISLKANLLYFEGTNYLAPAFIVLAAYAGARTAATKAGG